MISNFAANAGKKSGEFYTPHEVSVLISEIVAEHLNNRQQIKIYDGDWANQSTELKKKIEENKKAEGENGHGGRKYSDELKDVLPLNSGQKRPADFIAMVKDDGYEVDVYDLANVEVVEKKLFREDLYIQSDEYIRDAYFIHKPL